MDEKSNMPLSKSISVEPITASDSSADGSLLKTVDGEMIPLPHKRSRLATPIVPSGMGEPIPNPPVGSAEFNSVDFSSIEHVVAGGTAKTGAENARIAPKFNIYQAILQSESLTVEFVARLPVPMFISLYAIDRTFHLKINERKTNFILESARYWAPASSRVFVPKQHGSLTIFDPTGRENEEKPGVERDVPSLRWLQMVAFRERVVNEIIELLAAEGHRLPDDAISAIAKIWLLMTIPSNGVRIGLIHNQRAWRNRDIEMASMFFVKLDMRFSDPIDGSGDPAFRNMLLGQRSLILLWKALRREALVNRLQVMQEYVRYNYEPPQDRPDLEGYSILGVPPEKIGALKWEGWGLHGRKMKLLRPDELVVREAVRRRIRLDKKYLDYMLYGYIDLATGKNIPLPKKKEKRVEKRKASEVETENSEDESDDLGIGGLLSNELGKDGMGDVDLGLGIAALLGLDLGGNNMGGDDLKMDALDVHDAKEYQKGDDRQEADSSKDDDEGNDDQEDDDLEDDDDMESTDVEGDDGDNDEGNIAEE